MALCVSLCPPEELKTYQDLKKFAMLNGEGGGGVWGVLLGPAADVCDQGDVCVFQAQSCVLMS